MSQKSCDVEVFARVTGFFRPVQSWNKGKASEFKQRKKYDIAAAQARIAEDDNSRIAKSVTG